MIKIGDIEIKTNYVLIKPDKDYEKLRSGLYIGSTAETEARHYSITGEVILLPERLVYRGEKVKALRKKTNGIYSDYDLKQLNELTRGSMEYKTKMELNVGDRVWFDYLAHINANTERKSMTVEGHGECILIEYSRIFIRERDNEITPINGWIWIKKVEGTRDLGNGIEIPETIDVTLKNTAIVVKIGEPIEEYLAARHSDRAFIGLNVQEGDMISFNDKIMTPLEYVLHETEGMEKLYKIRRKDIYGILPVIQQQIDHFESCKPQN